MALRACARHRVACLCFAPLYPHAAADRPAEQPHTVTTANATGDVLQRTCALGDVRFNVIVLAERRQISSP